MRGGFQFNVQKWPVAECSWSSVAKKPHSDPRMESCQSGVKSLVMVHLPVLLILGRRGAMGDGIPDVLQSTTSLTSSSPVVQVGTVSTF